MSLEVVALLGDVGGTNIRLELVVIGSHSNQPLKTIYKDTYLVADYDVFQNALKTFLDKAGVIPAIAAMGIAGPIVDNTVLLSNVAKWGKLNGYDLGTSLNIKYFSFLNDFEAASYGVLLVPEEEFVSLNGKKANQKKLRGIIGPGTGLGNSTIYPATIKHHTQFFVLPSEGGHTDFPTVDNETNEFFTYLLQNTTYSYISTERSFCGPTIPYIYKYFAEKYPEQSEIKPPTSEEIIATAVGVNPPKLYQDTFALFLKLYSATVGNFLAHHLCTGGVYLVGGLTKSIISKLQEGDFLELFKVRHPQVKHIISEIPLLVCKEVDLGLKGAYFYARRIAIEELGA